MNPSLTICFLTCRNEPKIQWFFQSLERQVKELGLDGVSTRVVVVDFFSGQRAGLMVENGEWGGKAAMMQYPFSIETTPPKPSVWQGPHRLTSQDYFAASNARNTGLCLAPDGWIAYVDDLSVLMPSWLLTVRQAMQSNIITLGSYRKVKNLVVENGLVKSFDDYAQGHDSRWGRGSDSASVPCGGEWLFGCSLAAPVEALLTVGGWPEICDGMGYEDCVMGLALQNAGFKFQYSRSMLTYESEELHHVGTLMKRLDKGKSPNDKSHAVLNLARSGCRYFENFYQGGIRRMREEVLSSKPFPVVGNPVHDWFDRQPLSEM